MSLVFSDVVASRLLARGKRHVLCPYLDMLNHASSRSGSRLECDCPWGAPAKLATAPEPPAEPSSRYDYFGDAFGASLDPAAGPVPPGAELLISYGDRSNDQLLQYYGFVEAGNPHDSFLIDQQSFLLALGEADPYPKERLRRLSQARVPLTDNTAAVSLTAEGGGTRRSRRGGLLTCGFMLHAYRAIGPRAMQLARLLFLAEADLADDGASPSSPAGEERARRAVGAAAALVWKQRRDSRLEAAGAGFAKGSPTDAPSRHRGLARAFAAEKERVLERCVAACGGRCE